MKQELERLFLQREKVRLDAKNFLDSNSINGKISREEAKAFEKYEEEMKILNQHIESELSKSTTKPILNNPQDNIFYSEGKSCKSKGVSGSDYHTKFFNEIREGFRNAKNTLIAAETDRGGTLLPVELHDEIISELKGENILRQICRVVETQNDRRISIVNNAPTADFYAEGQEINVSAETFNSKILSAYKMAAAVNISNELMSDTYYNLEQHLSQEFAKAIATREEDAFLNGSGSGEPLGLIPLMSQNTEMTLSTAGTNIVADDIISLVYAVKSPYRRNGCFLMNSETLSTLRKLKNLQQDYIWQPSFQAGEPDKLLGYPVHCSEYVDSIASGNLPIIFGDFSKIFIAQRGQMVFKVLTELNALRDLTTCLLISRVDAVLSDDNAVKALKVK